MKKLVLSILLLVLIPTLAFAQRSWVSTIKKISPAIYRLVGQTDEQFQQHQGIFNSYCTAWMYNAQRGYLLTAGHCKHADTHYFLMNNGEMVRPVEFLATHDFKVVGDIGLLQVVPMKGDVALKLQTRKPLQVGDEVGMLGYGYGFRQAQFGHISLPMSFDTGLTFLDMSVLPGDSGGPILNRNGEVVGMSAAIYMLDTPAAHFGMAVSIPQILDFLQSVGH